MRTHLVLAPPPDVPADVELLLGEVLLAQHVVKLVHGRIHYVLLQTEMPSIIPLLEDPDTLMFSLMPASLASFSSLFILQERLFINKSII